MKFSIVHHKLWTFFFFFLSIDVIFLLFTLPTQTLDFNKLDLFTIS